MGRKAVPDCQAILKAPLPAGFMRIADHRDVRKQINQLPTVLFDHASGIGFGVVRIELAIKLWATMTDGYFRDAPLAEGAQKTASPVGWNLVMANLWMQHVSVEMEYGKIEILRSDRLGRYKSYVSRQRANAQVPAIGRLRSEVLRESYVLIEPT